MDTKEVENSLGTQAVLEEQAGALYVDQPELATNVSSLIDAFMARAFDSRQAIVFYCRVLRPQTHTLDSLGKEFGLSRERIRQIESKAVRRAKYALSKDFRVLSQVGIRLRRELGPLFPGSYPAIEDSIRGVLGAHHSELHRAVLYWLAGPYERDGGVYKLVGDTLWRSINRDLARIIGDDGATEDELLEFLLSKGIHSEFALAVLGEVERLHFFNGRYYRRKPTLPDRLAQALETLSRPATVEELIAEVDPSMIARNVSARLQADDRFIRATKDEYGLRSWGLEEYGGIADAIARAINAAGGRAEIRNLLSDIPDAFGVRPGSVKLYLDAPMFVVEGETVRRRRPDEPFRVEDVVASRCGVFRLGQTVSILFQVDSEALRGSGRPLTQDVVQALGLKPGESRAFAGEGFEIRVYWPQTSWSGGSAGSIRDAVESVGGSLGDELRLTFNTSAQTVSTALVERNKVQNLDPESAIALLTGIESTGPKQILSELNRALGEPLAGAESLLRARGDDLVADMVRSLKSQLD